MPDFVDKMHHSAKQLHEQKKTKAIVVSRSAADDDDHLDNKGGDKVPMWVSHSQREMCLSYATSKNAYTKESFYTY